MIIDKNALLAEDDAQESEDNADQIYYEQRKNIVKLRIMKSEQLGNWNI